MEFGSLFFFQFGLHATEITSNRHSTVWLRLTQPLEPVYHIPQVNAEGGENTVLELASAAQNVLDKWEEENEEEEQEKKRKAEAAAAAFMVDDEEEDLGM